MKKNELLDISAMIAEIRAKGLDSHKVKVKAIRRALEIVEGKLTGGFKPPHKLRGIEPIARRIATAVMVHMAEQVTNAFGLDLTELGRAAIQQHVGH